MAKMTEVEFGKLINGYITKLSDIKVQLRHVHKGIVENPFGEELAAEAKKLVAVFRTLDSVSDALGNVRQPEEMLLRSPAEEMPKKRKKSSQ